MIVFAGRQIDKLSEPITIAGDTCIDIRISKIFTKRQYLKNLCTCLRGLIWICTWRENSLAEILCSKSGEGGDLWGWGWFGL